MQTKMFGSGKDAASQQPVECLGIKFPNDEARRVYFLAKLKEKLTDPAFRKIEGFPIGNDDDILALSDPPYYTACPNPFLEPFVKHLATLQSNGSYRMPPFASDLTEGKADPIYDAHPYHTKVPPKALMRLLLHYTKPGDIVLDAFSGSGMLGVAASLCEDPKSFLGAAIGTPGKRYAILSDLSPLATFIGDNNARPIISEKEFEELAHAIVSECRSEAGWMFKTRHASSGTNQDVLGDILYTIWSEFYLCSECGNEFSAWDVLVDRKNECIKKTFPCPKCGATLEKDGLERATEKYFDSILSTTAKRNKSAPVWIHYKVGSSRFEKAPDKYDLAILSKIEQQQLPGQIGPVKMNFQDPPWGDFYRAGYHAGMTHAHHFFTKRNLCALLLLRDKAMASSAGRSMMYLLTGFLDNHSSKRNRYLIDQHHPQGTTCGPLPNSLYVPDLQCEVNPFNTWDKTVTKQIKSFKVRRPVCTISTTSASRLAGVPDGSIDYIFVDPPFGQNILYAESSFCWEYFLGVYTNRLSEAIVSKYQGKDVELYRELIRAVFHECFRVLKPGRWMTIEFSNRSNAVWNAISEAVQSCGFVVADVRVFDKKQGTIRQDLGQSIKKDLIISVYKPDGEFEHRFEAEAGAPGGAWDFVQFHLRQLPVFIRQVEEGEVILERQRGVLFERMVAFHVQRGLAVPLSASEFYTGLAERFIERDGMYFLADQVAEYDRKRATVKEVVQLKLFVSNEGTAVQWLRQQLSAKPQTFQELHPQFTKELAGWEKYEQPLELSTLLEQNFLRFDGQGNVPSQIHAYLSSNFKELRGREKTDPALVGKAKGRWYVPDPKKEADLEQLRARALLKEFQIYLDKKGKLKVVRIEALRAGFKECWQRQEYQTIVELAKRVPETVIQEDQALLMYFDNALMRLGV
jgi:DNA modification methylase